MRELWSLFCVYVLKPIYMGSIIIWRIIEFFWYQNAMSGSGSYANRWLIWMLVVNVLLFIVYWFGMRNLVFAKFSLLTISIISTIVWLIFGNDVVDKSQIHNFYIAISVQIAYGVIILINIITSVKSMMSFDFSVYNDKKRN